MIEFKKHQNEPTSKKVEVYKSLMITFWVLCGVMIIALVICAVYIGTKADSWNDSTENKDFAIFIVTIFFLVISSIGFAAFTAFGINFTLLYVHYRKVLIEENRTKNKGKNLV